MADDPSLFHLLDRLAQHMRQRYAAQMVARGYVWHQSAAGALLSRIDGPLAQAELTARSGLSKQAVQQLLDQLEAQGVIVRETDPADRRIRRVRRTALGEEDRAARDAILAALDAELRELVGKKTEKRLRRAALEG